MTRPILLAALLLAACHEPTGRINSGTDGPDRIDGGDGNDIICGGPCDPDLLDRLARW